MTFWAKVNKTEDCWLWTGNTRHGYGVYWHRNKRHAAKLTLPDGVG